MKYKAFIETYFMIDEPSLGALVPFIFNDVQREYYADLCRDYDIENQGLSVPIREDILKARREGFSSMILALFAADDILNDNPTESVVISYKDEATRTFRRRYRTFVLSYFAQKLEEPFTKSEISRNPNVLEQIASYVFAVDSTEFVLNHNRAHFYCGTASAKVGGRGGVLQKVLFSEIAFYPDTEKITAAEMVEATMRQVDIKAGWIFMESTENGIGTYQHKVWTESKKGISRFKNRFYGAGRFYSPEQIATIRSEYVDMDAFRRDYPMDEDDLFKGSMKSFMQQRELELLVDLEKPKREIIHWTELQGTNYIDQCEILKSELIRLIRENPKRGLYVGIDVAKDRDATVMTVIRENLMDLSGGVKGIAIDSTGAGDFMPDWFARNSKWYIEEVKFSRPTKSIMYKNLQAVIAAKLTSLPVLKASEKAEDFVSDETKHFWTQMLQLEKELIGNLLVVHHPVDNQKHDSYDDGAHDDYPDSWVLAEEIYVSLNGKPKSEEKPVVPTIPDAVERLLGNRKGDQSRYRGVGDSSFE